MTRLYCTTRRSCCANRKFQTEAKQQNIVVKWNLDDKLKVSNMKLYTGSLVSTSKCVNLVTHTKLTILCVIEADAQ